MPKVSIYVPDDMKARMDTAGERANWSAVAQRAFDVELSHLDSLKEIKSMTDVIDRLRASKETFVQDEMADGKAKGIAWAKQHAEYDELRRLAELGDFPERGYEEADSALAYWLFEEINPHAIASDEEVSSFFGIHEGAVGSLTREFVESFVEGASEVWTEVEDQL